MRKPAFKPGGESQSLLGCRYPACWSSPDHEVAEKGAVAQDASSSSRTAGPYIRVKSARFPDVRDKSGLL